MHCHKSHVPSYVLPHGKTCRQHQHSSSQICTGDSHPPCAPAACCAVMPLPGLLACVLLLSAVAIMESFWRRFLPGQDTWASARADQHREAAIAQVKFVPLVWIQRCSAELLACKMPCM
jgi:hypothetical protein